MFYDPFKTKYLFLKMFKTPQNLACPSAEAERSSMTVSTENTANQSRFPAQDRQV